MEEGARRAEYREVREAKAEGSLVMPRHLPVRLERVRSKPSYAFHRLIADG